MGRRDESVVGGIDVADALVYFVAGGALNRGPEVRRINKKLVFVVNDAAAAVIS